MESKKKRIIVFYPDFFGYGEKIADAMKAQGMDVSLHNSRSVKSALGKAVFKIFPELVLKITNSYYKKIFNKYINQKIDYILIIERVPIWFLKEMKKIHPNAKLILYMDDSINNLKTIEKRFPYFDRILTFDKNDADKNEKIIFRPLFFTVSGETKKLDKYKYDLCFIGTCHSDRYAIIKKIDDQCKTHKFYHYLYLQSYFMFWFYKIFKRDYRKARVSEFSFEKMDYKTNIQIEHLSKVILDIQHPEQTGLTIRTIEMLGLKKKIITTNKDIVNYDFYRKENIMVIDRKNPVIDLDFFNSDYSELSNEIYSKYEINQWIKDVLGD